MPTIEQLEPANKADVLVYMPYYTKDKHSILPYAITLYRGGSLEGRRHIENSEGIPFVASWYVSKLPSELTRCRLQFEGQADLSYEMTILNAELIEYLIGAIKNFKQLGSADFSQGFYRKLLQFEG
ncbi:MAG: hypothetical protein RPG89_18345 [Microcystis panniformis WG22]|nr:hypothetical protein [Microcystis panniformis WG22]